MSLLSVFESVSSHIPESFLAPIPGARNVQVFSLQDNIPYTFLLSGMHYPGWYHIDPVGKTQALVSDREVLARDKFQYLEQLPRFYVIAISPVNETTWLCAPYNQADAQQRGWRNGIPQNVYLASGNVQPFDVLVTRRLDQILLFEDVNTRIETLTRECQQFVLDDEYLPRIKEFSAVVSIVRSFLRQQQAEREEEERRQRIAARIASVEDQARWQLEFMGAQLIDMSKNRNGYTITWSHDGATFTQDVSDNLQIRSAGICLAGTDRRHNLSSIVAVMQEARHEHRYDLDEDLWL